MSNGSTTWNMTYDADGLRTKRTDGSNTYLYYYDGGLLWCMEYNGVKMFFTYDAQGMPVSMTYNGATYYYALNQQGDVMAILNASSAAVVNYNYNAWGELLSTTGSLANTIGLYNPLRYRGYVYDRETGLYYLQSRYYNPEWGRFINADSLVSNGSEILGSNVFAYCVNNPVNLVDPFGYAPSSIGKILKIVALIGVVFPIAEYATTVKHDVPLYSQGNLRLCWAYCQTMVDDFRANTVSTQKEADAKAKELAIKTNGSDNWNAGNWPTNCAGYDINGTPIPATGIDSLLDLYLQIRTGGPLYAYYSRNNKKGSHLVVVTGVNLFRGIVYTNNPWGIAGEQTYEQFLNGFAGGVDDGSYPFRFYVLLN